ncbi:hypothetical protein Val02_68330 [Virgisporangium aliadipatigenens]|uniref:Uncharacterized protein n=1 Tax=Virgisporangium aliadipatigenens TaxID=741659 RepID=A0A8J4DVA3_9ACTN|nr:proline-rich domain-containing protein [Virgisporangium aliadipatigenens]GIJ49947.1 hypothetical protein Val02_68330 [Virgisporangium aliadipatigenens]
MSDPTTAFHNALVDVHGNYRSNRLRHEPPDELVSDVVSTRVWRPHVVRSAFFLALFIVVSVISFFIWLFSFFAIVSSASSSSGPFGSAEENAGAGVLGVSYALLIVQVLVVVVWIVALFLPLREPIAEYGLLIEGRGAAAAVSYWWIMNTVRARQTPFDARLARVEEVPILLLANGREQGLVVVRPVGTDLYVGWTMWRSRSTVVLIAHMLRDMFQFLSNSMSSDVRGASARALRELIHSVTREGVQAAILQPPVADEVARAQIAQLPSLDAQRGPDVSSAQQFTAQQQAQYQHQAQHQQTQHQQAAYPTSAPPASYPTSAPPSSGGPTQGWPQTPPPQSGPPYGGSPQQ